MEEMQFLANGLIKNSQAILSISALIAMLVSTISIVLSIYVAYLQRAHNRNSVAPVAQFDVGDYSDKIYVRLINAGVGPLFVQNLAVLHSQGTCVTEYESLIDAMPETDYWKTYAADMRGRVLRPGKKVDLIFLKGNSSDTFFQTARNLVRETLKDTEISVSYVDIYGKTFPTKTRKLDWFERELSY